MRLTDIGPFFIVLGTVVSALPTRIQMLAKAGFTSDSYFSDSIC